MNSSKAKPQIDLFNSWFAYAKNLYDHALAITVSCVAGRLFIAQTLYYSRLLSQLKVESAVDYHIESGRFDLDYSKNNRLTNDEKELQQEWFSWRDYLGYYKDNLSSLWHDKARQLYVDAAVNFHGQIECHLRQKFQAVHAQLYHQGFFFKTTTIDTQTNLIDSITHALKNDSRTRAALIQLGWMNTNLKLTTPFQIIIRGSALEENLLKISENLFEISASSPTSLKLG